MFKVIILNLDSIGSACGYGTGKTLAEAQSAAMERALSDYNSRDYAPRLSESGYAILVRDGARIG